MRAHKLPPNVLRQPVDILVALDVSGSMDGHTAQLAAPLFGAATTSSGSKLDLCKQTLEILLRHMLPQDRFAVITYSDNARVVIPMQFMTTTAKNEAFTRIKSLRTIASTNISAAIALSFDELCFVDSPNQVRSIFLLTDGHANCGVTRQEDLVDLTRNIWRRSCLSFNGAAPRPISIFCFGYGTDHNSALLRGITDAAETGSYYFVKDDCDVGSAFGSAMGGILSIVAQSAVLTFAACDVKGVEIKLVHHDSAISKRRWHLHRQRR